MKKKLSRKEREKILSYLIERYGLTKDQFKGLGLFKTQRKIYITTQECLNDPLFGKAETAGIAIIRPNGVLKPTTDALQIFGQAATKNFVTLSKEDADRFIKGEDLELKNEKEAENGYVIMKYDGHILGCANLKDGNLKNVLPRSRRKKIQDF